MKVTVRPKPKEEVDLRISDIKPGYVFKIYQGDNYPGPLALKLKNDKFALLTWGDGANWFVMDDGSWGNPSVKILGKLTEIIVQDGE